MPQKLILPIPAMKMTANYLNAKYQAQWTFPHYGIDAVSTVGNTAVYALGSGTVIAAGTDGSALTGANARLGNCIVIVYKDVLCNDGKTRDLACRMFHFAKLNCKAGDKVTTGSVIGQYGSTGANTSGAHLHIEFDADTQYPQYAYGIAASGNIIKKGNVNSTVNPSKVWFLGSGQSIVGLGNGWTDNADTEIPRVDSAGTNDSGELEALRIALTAYEEKLEASEELISMMREDIAALAKKYA